MIKLRSEPLESEYFAIRTIVDDSSDTTRCALIFKSNMGIMKSMTGVLCSTKDCSDNSIQELELLQEAIRDLKVLLKKVKAHV